MKYYAGLDLGGTFVKGGIVDEEGNILVKDKIPTGKERPYEEIAKDMAELAAELAKRANVPAGALAAAGIGSPGLIDSGKGIVVYNNNLGWKKAALAAEVKKYLGGRVRISNDANCAALGETVFGAGRGAKNSVTVTLGTGVGTGIVVDGRLLTGNRSAGAEGGHVIIKAGGEKCGCGKRGCFEAYASATALIRQTQNAMRKAPESILWKLAPTPEEVDGKTAFDGLRAGDKTAEKVVNTYIGYLAEGLANLANIFRPEAIVLGGGVCAEGETLLAPLRRKMNRLVYAGTKYAPVLLLTASLGNDAGLVGAARFAQQH